MGVKTQQDYKHTIDVKKTRGELTKNFETIFLNNNCQML